eukprot:SAG11_NODE_2543_length_3237_cov_2.170172_4_plen_215_part_00
MDEAKFEAEARALAAASNATGGDHQPWHWCDGSGGRGYLRQVQIRLLEPECSGAIDDTELDTDDHALAECEVAEVADLSTLNLATIAQETRQAKFEVHVAYSIVYGEPILLFNMTDAASGALLSHDQMWRSIRQHHNGMPVVISQSEHPILGTPFYFVHPCDTSALMQSAMASAPKDPPAGLYLMSWLSAFGPIARTGVSVQLALEIIRRGNAH